jgi:hypothetical protein
VREDSGNKEREEKAMREEGGGAKRKRNETPLEVLAEVLCCDRAASRERGKLNWRDHPDTISVTRRPHPYPCNTAEERVDLCKKNGTPPLAEDWILIKQWGDLKECIIAIM